uniref:Reverse transcriptase domain-containing protein n=1 Tax=Tanacetum cinerariifolium TaxID=118510 RepID=A0A6L2LPK5_TANCI|nr:reverse transcriptase domain-containing protein [Tanacetum cinerariifolium]
MATEGNGDPSVPDLRTMEELCQPSLNGQGGPIAPIAIQATNFGLKNDMIQQVQNSCQFHILPEIVALKAEMAEINKNLMRVLQVNQQVKAVTPNRKTCGGPHSYNDCPATIGQTHNVYVVGAYEGGNSYQPQVVERETKVTKDTVHPTNNGSTKYVQPPVLQIETQMLNSKPVVAPIIEPVAAHVSAPKPNQTPSIPYPCSHSDAKFSPTIKTLLINKEKLYELARTPLNEYCLAVLLKKLPEKLGDPGERTLRVGKEAITFDLDQTSRYSANYNDMTANQVDVIDMAFEEYSQEVLGFFGMIGSGNPAPYYDPIVFTSSPTLTPFGDSDFLLKEVDAFLALEDDPTSPEVDQYYFDSKGDILLLEAFLNDDPSLPPPT